MTQSKRYRVEVRHQRGDDVPTVIEDAVAVEMFTEQDPELRDLLTPLRRQPIHADSHLVVTDASGEVHRFRPGQWREYRWQEVTG